ncbi:MAG: hypothetical protein LUP94_03640, partial [Candidatus Methanomethylicus sp.]|nr:hypothetical protein [Candidatus Methanomethylicus sp.]
MNKAQLEKVPIIISFKDKFEAKGELIRIYAPRTIESIVECMPIISHTFIWKEEIYFNIPCTVGPEKPKTVVQPGDIAYWPPGKAFCIFFGKTQPYSAVNVLGKITSDLEPLRSIRQGDWVN